eukprot:1165042-Rhodomonas_salina.1
MAKKAAASAEAEAAPAMTAELLCSKEFPELEGTYQGDLCPDAKKIWRYVDENPYFSSSDDRWRFKASFCTHPTAAQAAEVMACRAYFREVWQEPTCALPLALQQEGFGELCFRYLDLKWRDDRRGLCKAINKLRLVH